MKETIFDLLCHANVPRSEIEISAAAGLVRSETEAILKELCAEGRIAVSKKGKYATVEKLGLVAGRAAFLHNGSAVLRPLDGSAQLRIEDGRLKGMPEDLILGRKVNDTFCTLEMICQRARNSLPAFVRIEKSRKKQRGHEFERVRATAVPCDPRIPYSILLYGDLSFVRNNEIALVAIDEYPEGRNGIIGHAQRILGNSDSMLARMRATAESHSFPTEFNEEVEWTALLLARQEMPEPDKKRIDLRDMLLFTIDGASSKDFDDAVSIEKIDNGWRLGVHIADVSHYVRPYSPIDKEAMLRGTSLYLPGCTVPMLPEILSNDLCSLMPDKDRLAMSLLMEISPAGKVTDFRLSRSVICSKVRLTYDGVNRYWENGEKIAADAVLSSLDEMLKLSLVLRNRRKERGSIDFDLPEAQFVLNEKCEPVDILSPLRGQAERMIEDFMLLANETVARLARDTLLPFVYRVHERPDPDRIKQVEAFLAAAGTPVHLGEHPHPGMLQRVLDSYAGDDRLEIVRRNMLRSLKRAQYSEKPMGHYALSMEDYCHFTSPIRRYPDLMVHRMLKLLLDGASAEKWESKIGGIAKDCSVREFESVKAEREADAIMKAAFMKKQIGRKFDGVISGVTSWGVYVTLENTVEGLVHISDMDDFFIYNADLQQLEGSESGIVLRLGLKVRVRAVWADIDRGEVNFEFDHLMRP